ncbi:hypothetical protein Tco_1146774 [Tanacetum coccineum]
MLPLMCALPRSEDTKESELRFFLAKKTGFKNGIPKEWSGEGDGVGGGGETLRGGDVGEFKRFLSLFKREFHRLFAGQAQERSIQAQFTGLVERNQRKLRIRNRESLALNDEKMKQRRYGIACLFTRIDVEGVLRVYYFRAKMDNRTSSSNRDHKMDHCSR